VGPTGPIAGGTGDGIRKAIPFGVSPGLAASSFASIRSAGQDERGREGPPPGEGQGARGPDLCWVPPHFPSSLAA